MQHLTCTSYIAHLHHFWRENIQMCPWVMMYETLFQLRNTCNLSTFDALHFSFVHILYSFPPEVMLVLHEISCSTARLRMGLVEGWDHGSWAVGKIIITQPMNCSYSLQQIWWLGQITKWIFLSVYGLRHHVFNSNLSSQSLCAL